MKRGFSGISEKGNESMELTDKGELESCKVPRTKEVCNPSMVDGKSRECSVSAPSNETASAGLPLAPKLVNEKVPQEAPAETQPSLKEIAAAKAARIRLGLEEDDGTVPEPTTQIDKLPSGVEPTADFECVYVPSADLGPVDDAEKSLEEVLKALRSKDWTEHFKSLSLLRQLFIHHTDVCGKDMEILVPLVLKLVMSPRSSLTKMAVLCCADIFNNAGDIAFPYIDIGGPVKTSSSLLMQLLLKASSNDKQFVVDEVHRTLVILATHVTPGHISEKFEAYTKHRSPKIRGKAILYLVSSVKSMSDAQKIEFGLGRLLRISGALWKDNTQDARESAKKIAYLVHTGFLKLPSIDTSIDAENRPTSVDDEVENEKRTPWAAFCYDHLDALTASAVTKVVH